MWQVVSIGLLSGVGPDIRPGAGYALAYGGKPTYGLGQADDDGLGKGSMGYTAYACTW